MLLANHLCRTQSRHTRCTFVDCGSETWRAWLRFYKNAMVAASKTMWSGLVERYGHALNVRAFTW